MSLVDLTRTAFQGGVSAQKVLGVIWFGVTRSHHGLHWQWVGLSRLLIEQRCGDETKEDIELSVCSAP